MHSGPEALPHLAQLYSAALSLAGDPAEAEDLVVEAFARAYIASGLREPDASLRLRLYRSLASARREQRREGQCAASGGAVTPKAPRNETPAFAWPDPACVAETPLGIPGGQVRRALSEMPEDLRFTVHLADVEGFSCQEIAGITSVTAGTARARLRDGHRELLYRLYGPAPSAAAGGSVGYLGPLRAFHSCSRMA